MFDQWQQTVPANTAEADSLKVKLTISPGILRAIYLYFPAGVQQLAKCRVFLGVKPIVPRSAGRFVTGEDVLIPVTNMTENISENIPELTWELWNEDDTYDHTLWLNAEWITAEEAETQLSLFQRMTAALETFVNMVTGGGPA